MTGLPPQRIGFTDRLQLVNPPQLPICLQVVVEGTGALDPDVLADAVRRTALTCAGSRLTRRGGRWVDSGRAPAVRTLDGDPLDRATFRGQPALDRLLTGAGGEPMSEVVLLTGARPAVVFRVHHAVMDGMGAMTWVNEVFRVLRGVGPSGTDARTTLRDLQRRYGKRRGPDTPDRSTQPPPLRAKERGDARGYFFRRRTVDGRHPAVLAKIATALCGRAPTTFYVPVDLRSRMDVDVSTAPLTGRVLLPVTPGATWQQTQEKLLTMMRVEQDVDSVLYPPKMQWTLDRVPLPLFGRLLRAMDSRFAVGGRPYPAFTLSHLGQVDLADCSTADFAATTVYSLPVAGLMIPPVITIVETDGHTEIIISGDDAPGLEQWGTALLDDVVAALSPSRAKLRGAVAPADGETLTRLFARQVERSAGNVAIVDGETTLTYAELDARSDAVAAALVAGGVGPGALVGLIADRSAATIAGLWGVLKAGAAYLPLEPNHPDAWLADLLRDAGASACLHAAAHSGRPFAPAGCTRITLDAAPAGDAPAFDVPVAPEDLAYVIYTSGSTGRPKGVEVEHRHVVNYVGWATREYGIDAATRFPLFTSLAFDLPITAILLPLLAGGSIAVFPGEPNHVGLTRMLRDSGVTAVKLTPSHLDLITRLGITAPDVRIAIVGGERLSTRTAAATVAAFGPECRVVNEYGPTEATVGCVVHEYDPAADVDGAVPIGLPVDNVTLHVLDDRRAPVPAGQAGALYVSGAQTVRGYRGRPDLNRQLFVRLADGSRAYATGDLVRMLPSGGLDYLGRGDDQIKILGHRVEPAEIEAALETHPSITRAAVVARTRPNAPDKTLCAYVVCADGAVPRDVPDHLAARVPKHLIPPVVLAVPDLPLAPSGKVDTRGLPDPFETAVVDAAEPADPVQAAIAGIWASLLGTSPGGIRHDSDFYSLGGTSLTLVVMVAEVCKQVVSPERQEDFMGRLVEIISDPALHLVARLAAPPVELIDSDIDRVIDVSAVGVQSR